MPDITMCHGNDCPLKTNCYRYTAYADPYWQSIFTDIHYKDGKCSHFWDNRGKRNRPDGEPMFKKTHGSYGLDVANHFPMLLKRSFLDAPYVHTKNRQKVRYRLLRRLD